MRKLLAPALLLALAVPAFAQEGPENLLDLMDHNTPATQPAHRAAVDTNPHPIHSIDAQWSGMLLIVIGAMFVAAMIVGPSMHEQIKAMSASDPHGHDDHGHDPHDAHGHDAHGHGHGHH